MWKVRRKWQHMGAFSIGREVKEAVHAVTPEAMDAWPGGWPQSAGEFERLADVYLERLVIYASRRLGSVHDAEDAVQDVFVRAFMIRRKCEGISQVGAYLYRMTSNACTDVLRKRKGRKALLSLMEADGESAPSSQSSPSEALRVAEEASRAEQLLQHLPQAQAEAIRLRVFGELDLNEIAEVTECSTNTVNSRLRYGFRKLRRIVAKEWKS